MQNQKKEKSDSQKDFSIKQWLKIVEWSHLTEINSISSFWNNFRRKMKATELWNIFLDEVVTQEGAYNTKASNITITEKNLKDLANFNLLMQEVLTLKQLDMFSQFTISYC